MAVANTVLADRQHLWAFVLGCVAVTAGVLLHLPMFWMGRSNGFQLADMPMDAGMIWGMVLIVAGIGVAGYGLLPKGRTASPQADVPLSISAPEDAPLGLAHWRLMVVLTVALVLIALIPESAKFLLSVGRTEAAHAALAKFGCVVRGAAAEDMPRPAGRNSIGIVSSFHMAARTWALSVTAVAWGLINFGLLLWMPANLVAKGYGMAVSSELLAASALIAVPTVFVAAFLYSRWSSKGALIGSIVLTALGLLGVLHLELASAATASPVLPVAVLIVGINGIIAMLLPYGAESYPLAIRGRATGWVAACTKGGGLIAQLLSLLGLVPALGIASLVILGPVLLSLGLVVRYCIETRGGDLRDLEGDSTLRRAPQGRT